MSVVLGGVAVAGLAACTPEPSRPETTTAAPLTAQPEPSTTPTPATAAPTTAPTPPAAMEGQDEAGAIAAAEYFLGLYEYVYATGDLTEWDRISGQTCEFCANVRQNVEGIYGVGGRYSPVARTALGSSSVVGYDDGIGIYSILVEYDDPGGATLDSSGDIASTSAPDSGSLILDVGPSVRGWMLFEGDSQDGS